MTTNARTTNARTTIARTVAFAAAASIAAVTTTIAAAPTTASPAPTEERPCFIVQPRWNAAIDGPAPTCPTPAWQQATRTAPVEETEVATMADCVDTTHRPVVKTCPYPIRSGDRFSHFFDREPGTRARKQFDDEYDRPVR